jgi:hypothetical protein
MPDSLYLWWRLVYNLYLFLLSSVDRRLAEYEIHNLRYLVILHQNFFDILHFKPITLYIPQGPQWKLQSKRYHRGTETSRNSFSGELVLICQWHNPSKDQKENNIFINNQVLVWWMLHVTITIQDNILILITTTDTLYNFLWNWSHGGITISQHVAQISMWYTANKKWCNQLVSTVLLIACCCFYCHNDDFFYIVQSFVQINSIARPVVVKIALVHVCIHLKSLILLE